MPCPECGKPVPAEAFSAEKGPASGVTLYVARCRCRKTLWRLTRPALVTA
jgi:hypothetical protein